MRVKVEVEPDLQQLRSELGDVLGYKPAVHYDPDDGSVEVEGADPRASGVITGHAPDWRKRLSPKRRELLDLIEEYEGGGLPVGARTRLDGLLLGFVKEQLGGPR